MKRLVLAVLAAALAVPASAQDATLVKISGPVSILAGGGRRFFKASGGEQLLFGDTIRVGKGGIAQLALADRGAVLLRDETMLTLQGTSRRTRLSFRVGEFLIGLRKKLDKGESFKVRTPAAVAAVRGTLFWGKTDDKKATTYAGLGRQIAVTAQGKTVVVAAGRTTTVDLGSEPSAPKPHDIPMSYWSNFAVDGGLQGLEALVEADKPGP